MTKPSLPVVRLRSIDSTSRHAAQLLREPGAAGPTPAPFLVWAEEQTGGRGRHGHSWQSPRGNLYVTLVLRPPQEAAADHGLLPLKTGVVMARFIERHFGIRITLKWPNDILFAGSKLGGILLETTVNGSSFGELLIGIGLNVNVAPEIVGGDYKSIALHSLIGRTIDIPDLVAKLASEFPVLWDELPVNKVVATYGDYALTPDELCYRVDRDGKRFGRLGVLRDDGAQVVELLESNESIVLGNADHGWRWAMQSAEDSELVVADIGNSATKIAHYRNARSDSATTVEHVANDSDENALRTSLMRLRRHVDHIQTPLHVVSVRPEQTKTLMRLATHIGWHVIVVRKRPVRRHGSGYVLKELGIDRLCAIEGWLASLSEAQRRRHDHYGIVIAAGTATTIDVVKVDGEHLGGMIMPGIKLTLRSLHQAASLLPDIDPDQALTPEVVMADVGHDTRTAMMTAAVAMVVGSVREIRHNLQHNQRVPELEHGIVVTGGWGQRLATRLNAQYKAELVLSGARVLALGGWR